MKRLQIQLSDEAWSLIEAIYNDAGNNFNCGSLSYSDVINEMVLTSKVDIKALQLKHTDLRRSLRVLASTKGLDIEMAFELLQELKSRSSRKMLKTSAAQKEMT